MPSPPDLDQKESLKTYQTEGPHKECLNICHKPCQNGCQIDCREYPRKYVRIDARQNASKNVRIYGRKDVRYKVRYNDIVRKYQRKGGAVVMVEKGRQPMKHLVSDPFCRSLYFIKYSV